MTTPATPSANHPANQDHEPMSSEIQHDSDVCQRVIGRHGVSQRDLARESGIADGQLSRYLSGQYPLPVSVFAALWRLTRDADLLSILNAPSTARELVIIAVPRPALVAALADLLPPSPHHPLTPSSPPRPPARPPFFAANPNGVKA